MKNESNPETEEKVFVLTEKQVNAYNDWIVKGIVECDESHLKEWKLKNPCPLPAPSSKAVSITDSEIDAMFPRKYISNGINPDHWEPIGEARNMAAKRIRDEMLKRNVISIQRDKPFDREGAIKVVDNVLEADSHIPYPKGSVSPHIIDSLVKSGKLSSHLKEGEQRKPLDFEEWFKIYGNNLTMKYYAEQENNREQYKGYLTAFKL